VLVLQKITGKEIEAGADVFFLRPRLLGPPSGRLLVALSAPWTGEGRSIGAIGDTIRFVGHVEPNYEGCSVLFADANVLPIRKLGLPEDRAKHVELDTWIDAHAAAGALCVSSRLHPAIASASQGVPTIGIDYSDKLCPLLTDMGVPELGLELGDANFEALMHTHRIVEDKREDIVDRLLSGAGVMRKKAERALDTIVEVVSHS